MEERESRFEIQPLDLMRSSLRGLECRCFCKGSQLRDVAGTSVAARQVMVRVSEQLEVGGVVQEVDYGTEQEEVEG